VIDRRNLCRTLPSSSPFSILEFPPHSSQQESTLSFHLLTGTHFATSLFSNSCRNGGGVRVRVATTLPGNFGEFFVIHLFIREVVGPFGVDRFYAGRFPGGPSRHIRVRFNAVVASANSAATFFSPRIRNRRIPRCSFKIPMTGWASAFRRRYNARPFVEANLLLMRRRGA
jgi:hypothetical protein